MKIQIVAVMSLSLVMMDTHVSMAQSGPSGPGGGGAVLHTVACSAIENIPCWEIAEAYPLLFGDLSCEELPCKWDSTNLPNGEPANRWVCGDPVENPQTLAEQRIHEYRVKPDATFPDPVPVHLDVGGHHEFSFSGGTNPCFQYRACSLCDNGFIPVPQNTNDRPHCMPNDGPLAPVWIDYLYMGDLTAQGEPCVGCDGGGGGLLP